MYFYIPPDDCDGLNDHGCGSGTPIFPTYVTQEPILVVLNVVTIRRKVI